MKDTLALLGGTPIRQQPFSPWPIFGPEEEESLIQVLRSRSWGGYNQKVGEFEAAFAALHHSAHAISCSNGTVALELLLRAIGIGCGDEVVVPAFTFVATATSVLLCHGVPVFADIDRSTLNISPAALEAAITPRTKAVIVVHFGGQPADMDGLTAVAQKHGITLIEDCAHAHGAQWKGIPVGNFGSGGTFSFQAFKLITSGEGGMVLSNSVEVADKVWSYCNQGRRRDGGWYEHFTVGSNYRLTAFQAAVLGEQLRRLPGQTEQRARNVEYFREQIADVTAFRVAPADPRVQNHPHYLVTLRYDAFQMGGVSRDTALQALRKEGIPAAPTYPYPLYRNPVFRREHLPPFRCAGWKAAQDYQSLHLVECERVCNDGIWLEQNLFLSGRKDIDDIAAALRKVQQNIDALLKLEANTVDTVTQAVR